MTGQHLYANQYEDDTAQQLRLEPFGDVPAELDAEQTSENAKQEGGNADGGEGKSQLADVLVFRAGERYADSQGVNTGGNGKTYLCFPFGRIEVFLFFVGLQGFSYHSDSEEGQQTESYPMVECLDVLGKVSESCPATEGHEGLEETKEETHAENGLPQCFFHDDTGHDGYSETVHRQGNGQENDIQKIHHNVFVYCFCDVG